MFCSKASRISLRGIVRRWPYSPVQAPVGIWRRNDYVQCSSSYALQYPTSCKSCSNLGFSSDHHHQPPASYLGPSHSFRQADGGGNNLQYPDLGRAGFAYSRSVQGKWCMPPETLPDPGLIFDTLLKRRAVSCCSRKRGILIWLGVIVFSSTSLTQMATRQWPLLSLLWSHTVYSELIRWTGTSIILHRILILALFMASVSVSFNNEDVSHRYIDQATQDQVRDKELGRGYLYPDTFSEERLLFLPPASSALLVILSRNHNVSHLLDYLSNDDMSTSTYAICSWRSTKREHGRILHLLMRRQERSKMKRFSRLRG